jgi:hypothetical protein
MKEISLSFFFIYQNTTHIFIIIFPMKATLISLAKHISDYFSSLTLCKNLFPSPNPIHTALFPLLGFEHL